MDNLKENAFLLSLGGVVVLLIVCFVFLVYRPMSEISAAQQEVAQTLRLADLYNRPNQEVPTQEVLDFTKKQYQREKEELEQGIAFYKEKAAAFQLYFDDQQQAPEISAFYSRYKDEVGGLVARYREKHGIQAQPQGQGQPQQQRPQVENPGEDSANVALNMKKYWIIKTVFDACDVLGLDGLKGIRFEEQRSTYPRGPVGRESNEEKGIFLVEYVPVMIEIDMKFAEVKEFLETLFASPRVPFIDLEELSVEKIPDAVKQFEELAVRVREDPLDPSQKKVGYQDVIAEPKVTVKAKLRALDWRGLKPKETGAAGAQ